MNKEEFEEIMDGESHLENYRGKDTAFLGLCIISKYTPNKIITAAGHDIIYSVQIDEILEAGLIKEDAIELRNLNWMIADKDYLGCFV